MNDEFLLLNPGPVPVVPDVLEAMAEPMVSHRSTEFESVYARAQSGLESIFTTSTPDGTRTASDGLALILNGTATMGMEAAIANLTPSRDTEVVTLENGKFGRRFSRIADRHGLVNGIETEWGSSFDLDAVAAAITDETDVVAMVHNETSTGLLNPVEAVGELAHAHDALFVVDGVTSIGGDEFRIDDWHVDVAITDAHKALASTPGISAMFVTDRAIDAFDGEQAPFYEDLDWHVQKAGDNQTPFTSAVPLFRALAVAVETVLNEGISDRITRHRRQAAAFREAFSRMGLSLFPEPTGPTTYSNTVTAVSLPDSVRESPHVFFDGVADRNVSISGGQGHLGGEIFRVSNMGGLSNEQILRGVRTVGEAMGDADVNVDIAAGLRAAEEQLE